MKKVLSKLGRAEHGMENGAKMLEIKKRKSKCKKDN